MGQPGLIISLAYNANYASNRHNYNFWIHNNSLPAVAACCLDGFQLHSCRYLLLERPLPTLLYLYHCEQPASASIRQFANAHLWWFYPQLDLLDPHVQSTLIWLYDLLCNPIFVDSKPQHRNRHHELRQRANIQIHFCETYGSTWQHFHLAYVQCCDFIKFGCWQFGYSKLGFFVDVAVPSWRTVCFQSSYGRKTIVAQTILVSLAGYHNRNYAGASRIRRHIGKTPPECSKRVSSLWRSQISSRTRSHDRGGNTSSILELLGKNVEDLYVLPSKVVYSHLDNLAYFWIHRVVHLWDDWLLIEESWVKWWLMKKFKFKYGESKYLKTGVASLVKLGMLLDCRDHSLDKKRWKITFTARNLRFTDEQHAGIEQDRRCD